jgi:hypothetical protein
MECRGWDDQQLARGRVLTTAQDVLVYFGAPRVKVVADAQDIKTLEQAAAVKFADALRLALEAFATGHAAAMPERLSPLDAILAAPQEHGLQETTPSAAGTLLRAYLASDRDAEVVLLTPSTAHHKKYHALPGRGESLTDNWVFRIRLPNTFDRLIWSVVDPLGRRPAYCYISA